MQAKKIVVINCSPRTAGNCAELCGYAARAARECGAEAEFFALPAEFSGCRSCYACKRKGLSDRGNTRCLRKDGLAPVLDATGKADAAVFAVPVYFMGENAAARAFFERFLFPKTRYAEGYPSTVARSVPTLFAYAMNLPENAAAEAGLPARLKTLRDFTGAALHSEPRFHCAFDTCQFHDYSLYDATMFDPAHKKRRRDEQLPKDGNAVAEKVREMLGECAK